MNRFHCRHFDTNHSASTELLTFLIISSAHWVFFSLFVLTLCYIPTINIIKLAVQRYTGTHVKSFDSLADSSSASVSSDLKALYKSVIIILLLFWQYLETKNNLASFIIASV